jgi:hypothetical protein
MTCDAVQWGAGSVAGIVMRTVAIVIAMLAATGMAQAAEINAFISTAIKAATDELLPPFERANGHTIRASYGPSGALIPRFDRGEPVDVFLTQRGDRRTHQAGQGRGGPHRPRAYRHRYRRAQGRAQARRVVARSAQARAARGEERGSRRAGRRQHHGGAYPGRVPAARNRRRGGAEGQARGRRPQRPRQRAGLER